MTPVHWSIGEVLALLQEDYPEVTISKIRFLESQGLISPERTPSGYRRFFEHDLDRIRWILLQQRDYYLPLKVIKERLDASGTDGAPEPLEDPGGGGPLFDALRETAAESGAPTDHPGDQVELDQIGAQMADALMAPATQHQGAAVPKDTDALWDALADSIGASISSDSATTGADDGREPSGPTVPELTTTAVQFTAEDLAAEAGCEVALVQELVHFHLVTPVRTGTPPLFDRDGLLITILATRFAEAGLEPRHLRTFRLSAEREVGLLSQLVEPEFRRSDATARRHAGEKLIQLISDARLFHQAQVRLVLTEDLPGH